MAGLGKQTRGNGIARVGLSKGTLPDLTGDGKITRADVLKGRGVFKKGGMAMDESMAHEGAESMKMESKETKMEKKGFMENKKGKMVKNADKLTAKMSVKKKGKMMKGKR
jgi:hypothetical protein